MRQLAPVSPAIHLGAEKILVIGAGRMTEKAERQRGDALSDPGAGRRSCVSSIFLDGLAVDIERMQRINRTLSIIPDEVKEPAMSLRPIERWSSPLSERLDYLAARHAKALVRRSLLRGIGAMNRAGGR